MAWTMLFWDIDGTLLSTARAGILAWEQAVAEASGVACDLSGFATAGLTDHEIAEALHQHHGIDRGTSPGALVHRYEALLPEKLPQRSGSVLPGVWEILSAVSRHPTIRQTLLTGNTLAGARTKLSHYGLIDFFPLGGAFSDDAPTRPGIAQVALARARGLLGDGDFTSVVIGDTPLDVRCARSIGAYPVAVATGPYGVAAFEAEHPWWTIDRLPDPGTFFSQLESLGPTVTP